MNECVGQADERTHGKMPRVQIICISQILDSLQSTFTYDISCYLHNDPVKYKLSYFTGEDRALAE